MKKHEISNRIITNNNYIMCMQNEINKIWILITIKSLLGKKKQSQFLTTISTPIKHKVCSFIHTKDIQPIIIFNIYFINHIKTSCYKSSKENC